MVSRLHNMILHSMIRLSGLILALCVLMMSARVGAEELAETLKQVPTRIVYETWQDNNWELFTIRADGTEMANLTKTPDTSRIVSACLARRPEDLVRL